MERGAWCTTASSGWGFVNGHGSNVKVIDPVLRKLRYETGAVEVHDREFIDRVR